MLPAVKSLRGGKGNLEDAYVGFDTVGRPVLLNAHIAPYPQANRLKGWEEKHNWAWKFDKGRPVAMTVALDGDKLLKQAALTFDESAPARRLLLKGD